MFSPFLPYTSLPGGCGMVAVKEAMMVIDGGWTGDNNGLPDGCGMVAAKEAAMVVSGGWAGRKNDALM